MSSAPSPSVNGSALDLHKAAQALYAELKGLPWFLAVVSDDEHRRLVVEVRDLVAASQRLAGGYHGWPVAVKRGKAAAKRAVVVAPPVVDDAQGMCS